jgi:hypothetical protein
MQNSNPGNGNRMFIRELWLTSEYSGAVDSDSISKFGLYRFTGTFPTGGSALTSAQWNSQDPANNLANAMKANGGLTTTGTTIETTNLVQICVLNFQQTTGSIDLFGDLDNNTEDVCLNLGEGLCFQSNSTLVSGIALHGMMTWAEAI